MALALGLQQGCCPSQSGRKQHAGGAFQQASAGPVVRRQGASSSSRTSASGGGALVCRAAAAPAGGGTPRQSVLQTDPVQLAELLSQLSKLQVRPHQQWLQAALDTLAPSLGALSSRQLASTLHVLGGWGFTPEEAFLQRLHAALRAQLTDLTMRDIADVTWALAQLHNPRQPMLDELLGAAADLMQRRACVAEARGAAAAACAAAQPAAAAPDAPPPDTNTSSSSSSSQQHQQHPQQQQQPVCCPASLADLAWSLAKLQHNPGPEWLDTYAATSCALLPQFSPHELAQVVWAFARLPFNPGPAWMDELLRVIDAKLRQFDSKSVSLTAWALATLKVQPSARWLFSFERQAERTLSTLAAAELACTLWALSELKSKRSHDLRLARLVRRQEHSYHPFDFEALSNPRLLRVVRQLTLPPRAGRSSSSS